MGNASTKNEIDTTINETISVMTKVVQNCSSKLTQEQLIDIAGDGNVVEHVSFNSFMTVDSKCLQTTKVNNDIIAKIGSQMDQSAKSTLGALSLNPGNADAENITKAYVNLGVAIANTFNQDCTSHLASSQKVVVNGHGNRIRYISFNDVATVIKKCTQSSVAVNKASADLEQAIKQKATAEKKGVDLMFLFIVIIGIIGTIFVGGGKVVTNPAFLTAVIVLILIYIGLAYSQGWWPFSKNNTDEADKRVTDKTSSADATAVPANVSTYYPDGVAGIHSGRIPSSTLMMDNTLGSHHM